MKKHFILLLLTLMVGNALSAQGDTLLHHQSIFTNGANDFKTFVIGEHTYLAVANFTDNDNEEINSVIYRWGNGEFQFYQSLPTKGASDWEFFEIAGSYYLAVANYEDNSSNIIESVIYQWNGAEFIVFQNIPTVGAYDWDFFVIEGIPFLVVANQTDGDSYSINSEVYQWNGATFEAFQSILGNGATDWESFILDGETYLAVANVVDFVTRLYHWTGTSFVPFESLSITIAPTGVESFEIDDEMYLAVSSGAGIQGFNSISKIFKWTGTTFIEVQSIPTRGAFDWEYFSVNDNHYLAVANYQESDNDYFQDSEIFRWSGSQFESIQTIATNAAVDWEYVEIEDEHYLMVAEYKDTWEHNIHSRIFVFEPGIDLFIENVISNQEVRIYPNPCQDQVKVSVPLDTTIRELNVMNTLGEVMLKSTSPQISLATLPDGIYLMAVFTSNGLFHSKIVKGKP